MINRFLDGFPILIIMVFILSLIMIFLGLPVTIGTFLLTLFWASIFNFMFIYIEMRLLK